MATARLFDFANEGERAERLAGPQTRLQGLHEHLVLGRLDKGAPVCGVRQPLTRRCQEPVRQDARVFSSAAQRVWVEQLSITCGTDARST